VIANKMWRLILSGVFFTGRMQP